MGKFIRRLFIILMILTIVFLVYRYINPDGASKLVDKIKIISNNVPDVVWSDTEDELIITGTTLVISGDVDVFLETGNVQSDEDEGLSWLEELNKEIDEILGTDDKKLTGYIVEEDENLDFLSGEIEIENIENCIGEGEFFNQEFNEGISCCSNLSGFVTAAGIWLEVDPGELCYNVIKGEPICSNIGAIQEGRYYKNGDLLKLDENCHINILEEDNTANNVDDTSLPPTPDQGGGLTDSDYQQTKDIFGNLVE